MGYHTVKGNLLATSGSVRQVRQNNVLQDAVGAAPRLGPAKYEFLKFQDADGAFVTVANVTVSPEVQLKLTSGVQGTFIISKTIFNKTLVMVRIGDEEATYTVPSLKKAYVKLAILLAIGLLLSPFLIGIPLVLFAAYQMIRWPSFQRETSRHLEAAGFKRITEADHARRQIVI